MDKFCWDREDSALSSSMANGVLMQHGGFIAIHKTWSDVTLAALVSEEDTLKTNEKIVVLMLIVAIILFAASFGTRIDYRIVISSLGMLPILKTTTKKI